MKHPLFSIFYVFVLSFLTACAPKNITLMHRFVDHHDIPLFIEMPTNTVIFDHVSHLIYEALHRQYIRIGYHLVEKAHQGYSLRTTIKKLDPNIKLVSSNIVLLHYHIKAEIECSLADFNQTVVAKKTFSLACLISKPRNPIINSDFIDFEYRRLFDRLAPKIEYYFRSYLFSTLK